MSELDEGMSRVDELKEELEDVRQSNYRFRSEIHDLVNVAATLRVSRDNLLDDLKECQDNYAEMREEARQSADENFRLVSELHNIQKWASDKSSNPKYAYLRCPVCNCTWHKNENPQHESNCWVTP